MSLLWGVDTVEEYFILFFEIILVIIFLIGCLLYMIVMMVYYIALSIYKRDTKYLFEKS
jgi:hypothetical protein